MTGAELIKLYKKGERDLSDADLRSANLGGANLRQSMGLEYVQCSWFGHGECGRQLFAVRLDNEIIFYCGCFRGNARALIDYIIAGEDKYRASRYKAMDFLMSCFRGQVKK